MLLASFKIVCYFIQPDLHCFLFNQTHLKSVPAKTKKSDKQEQCDLKGYGGYGRFCERLNFHGK
uniref:Uncharacterized protein n=1 Tax=Anguilla anguilla TaxID=7936 RepID=A0A0E9V8B0_ANGAN